VLAVTPADGSAQSPGSVQITGSGFASGGAGANTVRFGNNASGIVAVIDDTRISCQVPPGAPGTTVDVVVSNANGTGQLTRGFRYHGLPTLTALSPTTGGAAGGTTVQVTGSGFRWTAGPTPSASTVCRRRASRSRTTASDLRRARGTAARPGAREQRQRADDAPVHLPAKPVLVESPGYGPASGGTRVTLRGSGFKDSSPGRPRSASAAVGGQHLVVSDAEICHRAAEIRATPT
jgi:hypothetical protein